MSRRFVAALCTTVAGLGLGIVPSSPAHAVDQPLCGPGINSQWRFGVGAGLDFTSGIMQPTTSAVNTAEGVATISNANGALLFYTDGTTVWGPNDVALPNGTGLAGSPSSTQAAVIVPRPGSTTQYYVFSNGTDVTTSTAKVSYSVVDTSVGGVYGSVLAAGKNTRIHGPGGIVTDFPTEKMAAIPQANGTDAWLVTTGGTFGAGGTSANPQALYIWSVTSTGVTLSGTYNLTSPNVPFGFSGEIDFSPDGQHIASATRNGTQASMLFDFDRTTGVVSDKHVITGAAGHTPYGVEFSPDSNLLYVAENSNVRQYNVNTLPINATQSDATATFAAIASGNGAKSIETGPDGKLYVAQATGGNHSVNNAIGVIQYPNVSGTGSTYSSYQNFFAGGATKGTTSGLPNSIACPSVTTLVDWSDAPNSYGSSVLTNGPRHGLLNYSAGTADLMLGNSVSYEIDGQPDGSATFDSNDDGMVSYDRETGVAQVKVTNNTADPATLAGWLDKNQDDAFDASERVVVAVPPSSTATYPVDFAVGLDNGTTTYLRFRVFGGTVADPSPLGAAGAGEVEDYYTTHVADTVAGVSVTNTTAPYNGFAHGVTVTTSPPGLSYTVKYDGSLDSPTEAGTYAVAVEIIEPGYTSNPDPYMSTLTIEKAVADVTVSDTTATADGNPHPVTVTTSPAGLSNTVTYDGSSTPPTAAGTYAVEVTITDPNYTSNPSPTTATLTIDPPADVVAGVAVSGNLAVHDGNPHPVTVTTSPPGLAHTVTYDGSATVPTTVGDHEVAVTITEPGYTSNPSPYTATLRILPERTAGGILVWGADIYRTKTDKPSGTDFVDVDTFEFHSIALRSDGSLVSWGNENSAPNTVLTGTPSGTGFLMARAGQETSTAIAADGHLVSWGEDTQGAVSETPSGTGYIDIAVGGDHSNAITAQGKLVTWGAGNDSNSLESTTPAGSGYLDVAAGTAASVAIKADGSLVAWGWAASPVRTQLPSGSNFVSVNCGTDDACVAVRANGTLVAWGDDTWNQTTNAPTGNDFVSASSGFEFSVAVKGDGTVARWGTDFGAHNLTETLPTGDIYVAEAGSSFGVGIQEPTAGPVVADVTVTGTTKTYTGSPQGVTVTTNPAGLAHTVTYDGSSTVPTNAGTYAVAVTITEPGYTSNPSPVTSSLTINKAVATVDVTDLSQTYNGSPRPVTVTTTPGGVATSVTYDGSGTVPTNAGTYAVSVTVTDPNYTSTPNPTTASLTISKAVATVSITGTSQTYNGSPRPVTVTTTPAGVSNTVTYDGSGTAPTNVGTYAVSVTVTDPNYTSTPNPTTASLTINKAVATVTVTGTTATFDGSPHPVTVTTVPAGLANTVTYNGSTTAPSAIGTYAVAVTITAPNYTSSPNPVTTTLTIEEDAGEQPEGGISSWGNNSQGQVVNTPTDQDFVQLAGGIGHSIGLRQDGSVKAWGRNDFGQAVAPSGTGFAEVDAGGAGSVVLRNNGTLTVWGRNVNNVITNAPTGNDFKDVALGNGHGSAVKGDGSVVSWGTLDGAVVVANNPTRTDFVEVDAGQNFTVGLTDDGHVVAWGSNSSGQVSGAPTGGDFISISANDHGAIAVNGDGTLFSWGWDRDHQVTNTPTGDDFVDAAFGVWGGVAVKDDGTLVSWGLDNERQVTNTPDGDDYFAVAAGASHYMALGTGAVTEDPTPTGSPIISWGNDSNGQVMTTPTTDDFVDAAGGIGHSIALRKNGSIIAWGRNDFGQAAAQPGTDFVEVDAGGAASIALRSNGTLKVWGRDVNHVVSQAPSTTGFVDVALGNGHGTAVKTDGTLVGWGDLEASAVTAGTPIGSNFVSVDAGQNFSVALTDDGSIVAWGSDSEGQVSGAPTGAGYVSVSANDHGAIAVHSDGSLHSWGWNRDNQVTNTPTGTTFLDAAFGVWGGVALKKDGTLVAWGLNNAHQVSNKPTNGGYVNVAAGASHYMAIGSDAPAVPPEPSARLSSWGSNSNGQIVNTPTGTFKQFDGAIGHSIGLRPNGTVVAWGRNDFGQAVAPTGNDYVDVAAGGAGSIALRSNGRILVWGRNVGGLTTNVPTTSDFIDVAIGSGHGVALKQDGSVVTWGQNTAGAVSGKPTGTNFVAVEAGQDFSIAIADDGSLVPWGSNAWNRVSGTPTGTGFVKVSISDHTAMALKGDGSIVAWGWDQYGQVSKAPKTGVYKDIAASVWGGAAVKSDGTIVTWGLDNEKQVSNKPKGGGYFAIAAGSGYYMALGSTVVVSPDLVETKLTKTPDKVINVKAKKATVKFAFTADQSGATFECKIDTQHWKKCTSQAKYKLALGKHTFQVRAVVAGRPDSTPEKFAFRIK
jgi:alpha-tubulin suppressor-like RCC1 family protein